MRHCPGEGQGGEEPNGTREARQLQSKVHQQTQDLPGVGEEKKVLLVNFKHRVNGHISRRGGGGRAGHFGDNAESIGGLNGSFFPAEDGRNRGGFCSATSALRGA